MTWRLVGRRCQPLDVEPGDLLRFSAWESGPPFRPGCVRVLRVEKHGTELEGAIHTSVCSDDYAFAWRPSPSGDGLTDRLARIEAELGLPPWKETS